MDESKTKYVSVATEARDRLLILNVMFHLNKHPSKQVVAAIYSNWSKWIETERSNDAHNAMCNMVIDNRAKHG